MRFLQADIVFPISSRPVRNGILVTEDDGTIADLIDPAHVDPREQGITREKTENHRGFLCPGFVNAHCHLELSHLKGKFTPGKGLPDFLKQIMLQRQAPEKEIGQAMQDADTEMQRNGIVAVGDISNTDHSFEIKKESSIYYHTFIEIFDLHPDRAEDTFNRGKALLDRLHQAGLSGSLAPHAPYTVSQKLLKKINDYSYVPDGPQCIHNQETQSEDEMFLHGQGPLSDFLKNTAPLFKEWKATGFRSLPSVLVHLSRCNKIGLIHNTYTTDEDIVWAHLYSMLVWWCFCPNANLFIENRLPDIPLFMRNSCKMMVGTDSYASNWSLSILDELKRIHAFYSEIPLHDLLTWSTLGGARFLGINNTYGSFEKGKKPGVNLLENVSTEKKTISPDSTVTPLV